LAISTSCAGDGGGSGGSGGQGGGGGGQGGSAGNTGGGTCSPGADEICFANNKAAGLMTGYGWVALGAADTITSPVCDNTANGGGASEQITKATPCPEAGGKTVWSSTEGLCMTGSIPVVTGGDYTGNWGLQIGWNASDPTGSTLSKTGYSKVTFTFDDSGISPKNTAIRGEIHRKGDPDDGNYCATLQSGTAASLTAFNTKCWDGSGTNLTVDDIPNIDKMGIQISSDATNAYTVNNFCITKIAFSN
jgi:hypothetical protein